MALFRKKPNVGLDIGSHSLQWAATDNGGKHCEVWRGPLDPDRRSKDDNLIGDPLKLRLRALIAQAERENRLWNRSVVVGVQGQSVISGYLELPKLRNDELNMAVLSNVSREVPFPVDSLEVVHLPVVSLNPDREAVFYSVWKKAAGLRLRQLCEGCELKVKRIEPTGVALTRELFQNRVLDPQRFYAIINVGFMLSQIVLVRAGYPYYLRDIPVGGRDITYAVQIGSELPWEEAEALKCSSSLYDLVHTAGPILGELSYEFSRSITYFRHRFGTDAVDAVYISGGSALLRGFPDWLEEELKLPVRREAWQQIRSRSRQSHPSLNKVATGLALGQ